MTCFWYLRKGTNSNCIKQAVTLSAFSLNSRSWFWLASVCHLFREECSCSKSSSWLSHNQHQICCTCTPTWPACVCLSPCTQERYSWQIKSYTEMRLWHGQIKKEIGRRALKWKEKRKDRCWWRWKWKKKNVIRDERRKTPLAKSSLCLLA